jgi:hypothetical protein
MIGSRFQQVNADEMDEQAKWALCPSTRGNPAKVGGDGDNKGTTSRLSKISFPHNQERFEKSTSTPGKSSGGSK